MSSTKFSSRHQVFLNAPFAITGSVLSLLGSSFMIFYIGRSKAARSQVRPRMMMVLASLDASAALLFLLLSFPEVSQAQIHKERSLLTAQLVLSMVGIFLLFTSWTWTCCIAYHVHFILENTPHIDRHVEKRLERIYINITFFLQVCIFFPLLVYQNWRPGACDIGDDDDDTYDDINDLSASCIGQNALQICFLAVQYMWIAVYTFRIHRIKIQNPAALTYRRQMLMFMLVFFVLTIQLMWWLIAATIQYVKPNGYINIFGVSFYVFMGFGNTLVWGLSRSCATVFIDEVCMCCVVSHHHTGLRVSIDEPQPSTSLEIPLLDPREGNDGKRGKWGRKTARKLSARNLASKLSDAVVDWKIIPLENLTFGLQIGKGNFGTVFEGEYDGHVVAIKEVSKELWMQKHRPAPDTPDSSFSQAQSTAPSTGTLSNLAAQELLKEANILAALRHPNTVNFYGVSFRYPQVDSLQHKHKAVKYSQKTDDELVRMALSRPESQFAGFLRRAALLFYAKSQLPGSGAISYYFVTEKCVTSLDKVTTGLGKTDGKELWDMITQVAAGMQYLHSKGVLHRDLKLGNVLVSEAIVTQADPKGVATGHGEEEETEGDDFDMDGSMMRTSTGHIRNSTGVQKTYKVCDFGLSRVLCHERTSLERSMTSGIGTPRSMAPELLLNDKEMLNRFPWAVDSFAFGIFMWRIVAGRKPYTSSHWRTKSSFQILKAISRGMRPDIPDVWPDELSDVIRKCWQHSAADRPSFSWLVQRFSQSKDGLGLKPLTVDVYRARKADRKAGAFGEDSRCSR